jgi:hypothetical protein
MLERIDGVRSKGEGRLAGGSHLALLVRRRLRASEGAREDIPDKKVRWIALSSSRVGKLSRSLRNWMEREVLEKSGLTKQ